MVRIAILTLHYWECLTNSSHFVAEGGEVFVKESASEEASPEAIGKRRALLQTEESH